MTKYFLWRWSIWTLSFLSLLTSTSQLLSQLPTTKIKIKWHKSKWRGQTLPHQSSDWFPSALPHCSLTRPQSAESSVSWLQSCLLELVAWDRFSIMQLRYVVHQWPNSNRILYCQESITVEIDGNLISKWHYGYVLNHKKEQIIKIVPSIPGCRIHCLIKFQETIVYLFFVLT